MGDFGVFAKDWQAAIAGVIVAFLYGFRIYLSAKKDLREDKAGESSSSAYHSVIDSLREENARLVANNKALRVENESLYEQIDVLRTQVM